MTTEKSAKEIARRKVRAAAAPPDWVEHGLSCYVNWCCRCTICTEANTAAVASRRAERWRHTQKFGLPDSVKHGTSAYSNWGCRCPICKGAHNADQLRWKPQRQEGEKDE